MKKPRFSATFRDSCRIVAEQCHGAKGTWAYDAFAFINDHWFSGRLPWAHIIWGLTPHGGCLAWSSTDMEKSRPPIILLHPSLLGVGVIENPWGVPKSWLGPSYVFDVLIHECIHIHIDYNLGGHKGRSSHDCARWIRQVNRLAPLLGLGKIHAGGTKIMRVPDHSAPKTKRGKVASRVVRATTGDIPFPAVYGFPSSLRRFQGTAANHFIEQTLPPGVPSLKHLR